MDLKSDQTNDVKTVYLKNIDDFLAYLKWQTTAFSLKSFCFRGEQWGLPTPLSPRSDRQRDWDVDALLGIETDYISSTAFTDLLQKTKKFLAHAKLYNEPWFPEEKDFFGSMALIAHYGGTTPLLDVTRSLLVASYFGSDVDSARCDNSGCVWVFCETELENVRPLSVHSMPRGDSPRSRISAKSVQNAKEQVKKVAESFHDDGIEAGKLLQTLYSTPNYRRRQGFPRVTETESLMSRSRHAFVYRPLAQSPRLEAQQGQFIIGLNPTFPLLYHLGFGGTNVSPNPVKEEDGITCPTPKAIWPKVKDLMSLKAFKKATSTLAPDRLWRLKLSRELCNQLQGGLLRQMNIRQSILFPDLVGLAESIEITSGTSMWSRHKSM